MARRSTGRVLRMLSLATIVGVIATACSGGGGGGSSGGSVKPTKGGTLNVATDQDVFASDPWGPQEEYFQESFALFRCCLLRTLMSYNGKDAAHNGTAVFPDLAASAPTVSTDGLTWTFHLKQGLHYAPPLQSVEITSADFVRALLREGDPNVAAGYPFYYDVIQGFQDYTSGKAKTIAGLVTPDKYTLEIHLTQPAGDLGFRFAMPATAPIPPNPTHPDWPLGIAQGHDNNFGGFVVSSGPYMWAGSQDLNFDAAPSKQKAVSGLQPGKSWTFVRNPSWAQDSLRPAYIDGMNWQISPGADPTVLNKKVTDGELDTVFENSVPPTILRQYQTTSNLRPMLHVNASAGNYYISLNTAVAPLDDIHVRKAIEYAVDKAAIQRIRGGPIAWPIGNHFVPDSLLTTSNGTQLLKSYDPYATPASKGDDTSQGLALAKKEMAQSKYDPGHTGMCTDPACKNVLALGGNTGTDPAFNSQVASNLAKIGIVLDLKQLNGSAIYAKILDPANKIPIALTPGWLQDYPDAYTFFFLIAYGPNILSQGNSNYSMVGATSAQLHKYGYTVTSVPSIDSQISGCFSKTGDARVTCWANVDKAFMDVAPVVPLDFSNTVNIVSNRVVNYTYSAFDSQTAYDQIALNTGASSSP